MRSIEISHRTIIFTVFFLASLWFLYQIRAVILLLFIAIIFTAALNPIIDRLEGLKIPRPLAILLIYLIIWGLIGYIVASIVPLLIEQTKVLLKSLSLPVIWPYFLKLDFNALSGQIDVISKNIASFLKIISTAFSNAASFFMVFVLTFFLLLERKKLHEYIRTSFGDGRVDKVEMIVERIEKDLGGWVRGELILMFIVGLMSYIGLLFLGVSFALPLALLAGFLELLPNIGPTISAIPAILAGLTISPVIAVGVLCLYIIIQQLENNIIVPKVMQATTGLHPLISLTALLVGFTLGGVGGAVLSLPIALVVKTIVLEIYSSKKFQEG